ncbi:MAG: GNAT family N-acetyltransferase [Cytophagales bacterium]|nr:GNAT family N-acetyltransferase [Cytophagales bacterium]
MISIRKALPEDASTIVDFQIKMAQETENLVLEAKKLMPGTLAVFDDASKGTYYVAVKGDEVIGCLLTTYEWSEWRNGTVLWIQSVYILEEYRGQKVFRKMYEHIQQIVEQNDAYKGIRLYVEKGNTRAQKVYTALGMDGEHYRMFEWIK